MGIVCVQDMRQVGFVSSPCHHHLHAHHMATVTHDTTHRHAKHKFHPPHPKHTPHLPKTPPPLITVACSSGGVVCRHKCRDQVQHSAELVCR